MKKLRLDLSELRVESFASSAVDDGRGTVQGNSDVTRGDGMSNCHSACPASCIWAETCNGPGICFPDSGICGSGLPDC